LACAKASADWVRYAASFAGSAAICALSALAGPAVSTLGSFTVTRLRNSLSPPPHPASSSIERIAEAREVLAIVAASADILLI
jgi:hypothetical protein